MTEQKPADNVVDITEHLEDQHLLREHGLVKTTAFVRDPDAAKKRTGNAERQARHRAKKAEAGLVPADVPQEVAEAIKAQGFGAWLDAQRAAPPREIERIVEVEKPVEVVREVVKVERIEVPTPFEVRVEVPGPERIVEVPAKLSQGDRQALAAGKRLAMVAGWRRRLLEWLL